MLMKNIGNTLLDLGLLTLGIVYQKIVSAATLLSQVTKFYFKKHIQIQHSNNTPIETRSSKDITETPTAGSI